MKSRIEREEALKGEVVATNLLTTSCILRYGKHRVLYIHVDDGEAVLLGSCFYSQVDRADENGGEEGEERAMYCRQDGRLEAGRWFQRLAICLPEVA